MREKKYQYVFTAHGWGGELHIHKVTQEFFDYAEREFEEGGELRYDLQNDIGEDVPVIRPNDEDNSGFYWHEGDLADGTRPMSVQLEVYEVPAHKDARELESGWDEIQLLRKIDTVESDDLVSLVSLEKLFHPKSMIDECGEESEPCLAVFSEEKGFYGFFVIDTDEPYDRKHLFKIELETCHGVFIDDFHYMTSANDDKSEVEWVEYPEALQKDFHAEVGYRCPKWWDEYPNSSFQELYEDVVGDE